MASEIDVEITKLAQKILDLSGAESEAEAIRDALRLRLIALEAVTPLVERLKLIRGQAKSLGPVDPDFDQKAFSDGVFGDD